MSITRAAIEKNRVTLAVLAVVLTAGISSFMTMPRSEDPGFTIRTALVLTFFPGASPERVEQLVTDKLEKVVQEMPELDFVASESKNGVSVVFVNIQPSYTEMRPIWDDLRRKVDKIRGDLPEGIVGPTVNDEFGDVFGVVTTLTGEGYSYAELKEVADDVRDELLLVDDVAKVEIYGAQEERVFVEYNNARLAELGLSPLQLQSILQSRNIIIPGGSVTTGRERIVLEPSGNFETLEDLRRTVISLPGRAELVYLQDVAEILRGYVDPPESKMRTDGTPSLALAVSMREGGNVLRLGEEVRATVERLQAAYPIGVELGFVQFQPRDVERKIDEFIGNLRQAIFLVMLVMLLFLGLRTGLVVASLIPMAMVMSFLVMSLVGVGINQMSLAALIIALGMLVDNAIVMSESILVQMEEGKPAVAAAVDSARELRIPLLTSSLTTAAAFLPFPLAEAEVGEYTGSISVVVTITLLSSWILAITVIPLLCVLFVRVKDKHRVEGTGDGEDGAYDSRFYRLYRRFLLTLLRHRWLALAAVAGIFVLAMVGFGRLPVLFFPPNDRPTFLVELHLPTGSPIEATEEAVLAFEEHLESLRPATPGGEGVAGWAAFIGRGAPRFVLTYNPEQASPEYAIFVVNATSRPVIDGLLPGIRRFAAESFPDLEVTADPLQLGPPLEHPVEVRISGRKTGELFTVVEEVKARLAAVHGAREVGDDWGARSKKLLVQINEARAQRAGVTNQDVAISLQTVLSGFETTEFREGDKLIPVTLRSVAADRQDLGKIESLNVFAQATGRAVPLKQVADVEISWQPAKILRRDRLRTVTVYAALAPGVTATEVNAEIVPWLVDQQAGWDLGTSWELGGEAETSGESQGAIFEQLPLAGLIVVLLLVAQFNSFRKPLIILISIPLGVIGVVLGLTVTGSYFGFMTLLGIISLAGVVINNAIVLLDRIQLEIDELGHEPAQAVVEAAQRRLRPILLTTCTTVVGLLPLWLGGGPMWEPMAIALVFGLLFATLLTLGVVPVLYSLFFRVRYDGFRYRAPAAS